MKKLFPGRRILLSPSAFGMVFGPILAAGITSCANQVVHWDAVQMRRHVMDYYTDEIMENLIRAKNGLPFVHVDVASLSALSTARVAATVGGGQTLNNSGTNTSTRATGQTVTTSGPNGVMTQVTRALAGAAGLTTTIVTGAMRPFTVSATPEESDNLTIVSSPVVGNEAATTIHCFYVHFAHQPDKQCCRSVSTKVCSAVSLTDNPNSLTEGVDYVPETMKKWGGHYYYVPVCFQPEYEKLYADIFGTAHPKPAGFIQTSPFITQP
jgi:hypothetical protein